MKKKILFVNGHLNVGGVEKSLIDILKNFNYEEYEVDLIRIKTKVKTIKISGDKLSLKYITDSEIGIKGIIYNVEYVD